jgi:CheY-like chemotaxis protein
VAQAQRKIDPLRTPAAQRVVLVAEDNDLNFELLSAVLERDGHRVRWARNGPEAVTAVAADPPDLLILDLHLPELSGLDVLRRVRADLVTREVPVLVLTADAMAGTREEALGEGANDIVTKPFELNSLRSTIARLLR